MSKNHDLLLARIQECYHYRELIANYPDKFNLQGFTQKQWLQYYDEEISRCAKDLEIPMSNLKPIVIFSIISIILLSFFLFKPSITSLTIYTPEQITFEINKSVSLSSYLLLNSGSQELKINISEFNLEAINDAYELSTLTLPLSALSPLNLSSGSHIIVVSLIDNGEIKPISQL